MKFRDRNSQCRIILLAEFHINRNIIYVCIHNICIGIAHVYACIFLDVCVYIIIIARNSRARKMEVRGKYKNLEKYGS